MVASNALEVLKNENELLNELTQRAEVSVQKQKAFAENLKFWVSELRGYSTINDRLIGLLNSKNTKAFEDHRPLRHAQSAVGKRKVRTRLHGPFARRQNHFDVHHHVARFLAPCSGVHGNGAAHGSRNPCEELESPKPLLTACVQQFGKMKAGSGGYAIPSFSRPLEGCQFSAEDDGKARYSCEHCGAIITG